MSAAHKRLSLIASLVPAGAKLCDVGTDHALLPITLIKSGWIQSAIACDIAEGPLCVARKNLERWGIRGIELRLSDGLDGIKPGEADVIVVAGLGGELTAEILARCCWLKDSAITLILQPTTSADILRRWLCENGFLIETEPALLENGKLYSVIKARFTGEKADVNAAFYYAGKVDPRDRTGALYIGKQLTRCMRCAESLKPTPKQEEYRHYKELADGLAALLEIEGNENNGI